MTLSFRNCLKPTLGVEMEIQLLDPTTYDLATAAIPILQKAPALEGLHAKSELLEAMVEINTGVCDSVKDVGEDLQRQLDLLRKLAYEEHVEIAVSGSHPFQNWRERKIYPAARYMQILEKFQWLARRWTTFGLHVHVGVRNGERAIAILNGLIPYIPHILALSASSPFWGGTDTGLVSSRTAVLESFPTGGLPYFFPDWKEFEKYFEMLSSSGAIESIKDLYWDIRPHFDFGTIEVRVCDGIPTLKETLSLAALIQCLVVWLDRQLDANVSSSRIRMQRYWIAPENKWRATRYGLDGQMITRQGEEKRPLKEEIKSLVADLEPVAASLGCLEELQGILDILSHGSSAIRQRKVFQETGSLKAVVRSLVSEFRENQPSLETSFWDQPQAASG